MKEAADLSSSSSTPSPHFHAHPVTDSDLFEWHFTLAGPPEPSPYANGIYHGRIVLPPQYPLRPPSFRFLTPSGRFEVNREICLSISGHHEESWQPAWGIRTALTAIRSFMDGEAKGQLGGLEAKEAVRKDLAGRSRRWRCQACGGRTNEEVLKEWKDACAETGINIDEEGRETVPEGLKVGFKDEMGKKDQEKESEQPDVKTEDGGLTAPTTNAATHMPSNTGTLAASSSALEPQPINSSQHVNPSPSPTPTTTANNPGPPAVRPPVPGQQLSNLTRQAAASSNDALPAWIDRAIGGLVVALIFMILRKVVSL